MGALLRIERGALWQFRCRGGTLSIEESLWVDGAARRKPLEVARRLMSEAGYAAGRDARTGAPLVLYLGLVTVENTCNLSSPKLVFKLLLL